MKQAILALGLCCAAPVWAHELRPAYLDVHEEKAGEFHVLWKTPRRGEMRLALSPVFSGHTESLTPVFTRSTDNAAVRPPVSFSAVPSFPSQSQQCSSPTLARPPLPCRRAGALQVAGRGRQGGRHRRWKRPFDFPIRQKRLPIHMISLLHESKWTLSIGHEKVMNKQKREGKGGG
jgi:hypothetical protein